MERVSITLPVALWREVEGNGAALTVAMIRTRVPRYASDEFDTVHDFTRGATKVQYRVIGGRLWMPAGDRDGPTLGRFDDYMMRQDEAALRRRVIEFLELGIAQYPKIHLEGHASAHFDVVDARERHDDVQGLARAAAPELSDRICVVGNRIWCRSHGPILVAQSWVMVNTPAFKIALGRSIAPDYGMPALSLARRDEALSILRRRWPEVDGRIPDGLPDWEWDDGDQILFFQAENYLMRQREWIDLGRADRHTVRTAVETRRILDRRRAAAGMGDGLGHRGDWHLHARTVPPPDDDLVRAIEMTVERQKGPNGSAQYATEGRILLERIAAWRQRIDLVAGELASLDLGPGP